MVDVLLRTLDGGTMAFPEDALTNALNGSPVLAGDPAYDEARSVWNAMIDRRPGVIARTSADVRCARGGSRP